jgi:hypothetical protein
MVLLEIRRSWGLLLLSATLVACDSAPEGADVTDPGPVPVSIDERRSLMITDEEILKPFAFRRLMTVLAGGGAGDPSSAAALDLFHQWWDTQNDAANAVGPGVHCDAEMVDGVPAMNGYPLFCPRAEGGQASVDPFEETLPSEGENFEYYFPIGLANRFDLATMDGSSCGEYRVLYAKRSSPKKFPLDRNLIIFEGGLPNPRPDLGIEGCRPVAEFLERLSTLAAGERAAELEAFYFEGLPGFGPVVAPSHYDGSIGRIRSNQFVAGGAEGWTLKEFVLVAGEQGSSIVPVPVAESPFVDLFDSTSTHPRAAAFREFFLTQVASLAKPDIERFFMQVPAEFLPGEGISGHPIVNIGPPEPPLPPPPPPPDPETDTANYFAAFKRGAATDDSFHVAIQGELTAFGSSLTPEHIVKRALTRSCAGCHEISGGPGNGPVPPEVVELRDLGDGLQWSGSLGFVHVSEENFLREAADDAGSRYGISAALKERFLPHRKRVLEQFLASSVAPSGDGGGDGTLGGRMPED